MKRAGAWYAFATAVFVAFHVGIAAADPQVGWWWNPNESGRGFFIESQAGSMYLATYVYADDGRARWLVAGGPNADPNHFSGRLLEFAGGQTLLGAYVPPGTPGDAGAISVDFADDTHGTITWPGGVVPIQREIFGSGIPTYLPESGWWWNPTESGSGYSIEVQGNTLFFVGFMYDAAGKPVWYLSAGAMTSATTYSGSLLQYANGQTVTGPYHPPGAPTTAGTLNLTFTTPTSATLTFAGTAAAKNDTESKAGGSRSIPITREFQPPPHRYDLPAFFDGSFAESLDIDVSQGPITTKVNVLMIGSGMFWQTTGQHPTGTQFLGQVTKYVPQNRGNVSVTVNYLSTAPDYSCTGLASKTFTFTDLLSGLLISDLAQYQIQIGVAGENVTVSAPLTCIIAGRVFDGGSYVFQSGVKIISPALFAQDGLVSGSIGPIQDTPNVTRSGSWLLTPSPNSF